LQFQIENPVKLGGGHYFVKKKKETKIRELSAYREIKDEIDA
jgi:hypothetical protein